MADSKEIEETILEIIAEQLIVDLSRVTMKASFSEDLEAKELDLAELFLAIEENFNLRVTDSDMGKIKNARDLVNYVLSYVEGK